ncbi:AAA family ATPase [Lacrimispora xylanisolvens]|uniref:AAA family ATPase n=1 Tax=Lacrimispora xylanisolvens TaxID=384636 RepID=UPI002402CA1F
MRKIYIPYLKSITIEHFSLYKQKPTFSYDFVTGVNLIIGVNGIGKTTFISLMKYGLIGGYKKDSDVKIYNYQKRKNRKQFNNEFFRERMDLNYKNNEKANISLTFQVGDMLVMVKRSLYDLMLLEVYVKDFFLNNKQYYLHGDIVKQKKYEKNIQMIKKNRNVAI